MRISRYTQGVRAARPGSTPLAPAFRRSGGQSALESALVQVSLLFVRHGAAENEVAMGEPAEAADDVAVVPGVRDGGLAKGVAQHDGAILIGQTLRPHAA